MKCWECENKLSDYIEHSLLKEEQEEIERHLATCISCRESAEHLRAILESVRTIEEVDLPESLHEKIMEQVRKEKNTNSKSIGQRINLFQPWIKYVGSVAAVIVFAIVLTQSLNIGADKGNTVSDKRLFRRSSDSESKAELEMREESADAELFTTEAQQSDAAMMKIAGEEQTGTVQKETLSIEEWEVTSAQKEQVITTIKDYIIKQRIEAVYEPNEEQPEQIVINGINDKGRLLNLIKNIDHVVVSVKNEQQGDNLKISFKP